MQMMTERSEPAGEAKPIGSRVSGNLTDARYDRGIRAQTIDRKLWQKEMTEYPQAVKNPLKQKWIPANMQSQT